MILLFIENIFKEIPKIKFLRPPEISFLVVSNFPKYETRNNLSVLQLAEM